MLPTDRPKNTPYELRRRDGRRRPCDDAEEASRSASLVLQRAASSSVERCSAAARRPVQMLTMQNR